jgi:hypothetical protein
MLLFGVIVQAQTSSNPVGKWDYSVPEAPYEYSKGKAEFKMQDGKLMMVMIINEYAGNPMEVTKKDNAYVCKFAGDGFEMTITLKPDGDNLKGNISSDQFDVSITMTPAKQ